MDIERHLRPQPITLPGLMQANDNALPVVDVTPASDHAKR